MSRKSSPWGGGKSILGRGNDIYKSLRQKAHGVLEKLKKQNKTKKPNVIGSRNNPKSVWILVSKHHFSLTKNRILQKKWPVPGWGRERTQ